MLPIRLVCQIGLGPLIFYKCCIYRWLILAGAEKQGNITAFWGNPYIALHFLV